jgi:hypothetical protein
MESSLERTRIGPLADLARATWNMKARDSDHYYFKSNFLYFEVTDNKELVLLYIGTISGQVRVQDAVNISRI